MNSKTSEETSFVFVTPAFNCQEEIRQTILSVCAQSYKNWRMVVYDDLSEDATSQVVEDMSRSLDLGEKLRVVSRTEKYGEVRNTYDAVQEIGNHEVICRLDAGDWLTETDCLHILDAVYRTHSPAVLWTKHRWAFTDHNISGPLTSADANVYGHPWVSSHLKTFRRDAMNGINDKNYLDEDGEWIMIACDQAVFLPLLHKAYLDNRPRLFLPRVMYHYNIDLADPSLFTCDRSITQKVSAESIRERGYIS